MLLQVLVTLTVLSPAECKPLYGPGCDQVCPVSVDASNRGSEPVTISKATLRAVMVSKAIPAVDDALAFGIYRQRSKDETWGKLARYATFEPLRWGLVALAAWRGGPTIGLTASTAYEFLDQAAARAAARAPDTEGALAAIAEPHITIMPQAAESAVVFTPAQFAKELPWERRVVYEWLVDGISVPAAKALPAAQDAPSAEPAPNPIPQPETPQDASWCATQEYFCGSAMQGQWETTRFRGGVSPTRPIAPAETLDYLMSWNQEAEVARLLAIADVR